MSLSLSINISIYLSINLSIYLFFSLYLLRRWVVSFLKNFILFTWVHNPGNSLSLSDTHFKLITIFFSNSFDLEDFKYNQVNMTAFRIVDSDNEDVQRILHEMESISALGRAILNQSQVTFYLEREREKEREIAR